MCRSEMVGDGDYAPGELVGDAVDATLLRQVRATPP